VALGDREGGERAVDAIASRGGTDGWRRRWEVRSANFRGGVVLGLLFGAVVFLWSAGTLGIELALGYHTRAGSPPPGSFAVLDALWHLATGFIAAIPARQRTLLWAAPLLSLGLDIDHLFGGILPTVIIRPAHDLFLLALVAVVLYATRGRFGAFAGPAAILIHIGVDGGTFPFLAPVTLRSYPLIYPFQVAFVAIAVVLMFLAAHRAQELRRTRTWIAVLAAIVLLAGLLALIPSGFASFTSN
jgi:hypothetical protein